MTRETPAVVRAIIDAANRGDTTTFLACFTPDGTVDDWGREFRAAPAITGWSEKEFIGARATLEVLNIETSDDDVTVTAQVGGDGFNGPSHFTFHVEHDLVSRMTIRA
jgi:hypothetical protein